MRIDEAVDNGASSSKACERLGITERTHYRWVKLNKTFDSYGDRRTFADHSNPINKITPAERAGKSEEILNHRKEVYEAAKAAQPERWNGRGTRNWDNIDKVF